MPVEIKKLQLFKSQTQSVLRRAQSKKNIGKFYKGKEKYTRIGQVIKKMVTESKFKLSKGSQMKRVGEMVIVNAAGKIMNLEITLESGKFSGEDCYSFVCHSLNQKTKIAYLKNIDKMR